MKQHKWHKEIHAWADGAEIEYYEPAYKTWEDCTDSVLWDEDTEYRIKPQPKEPQYLYVYGWDNDIKISKELFGTFHGLPYIGKIPLEE